MKVIFIGDIADNDNAWDDLQLVMWICGLGDGRNLASVGKQSRYVNYSPTEFNAFETLTPVMLEHGVVPGGWQHFHREEKICHSLPLINQLSRIQAKVSVHV
jgi:hypothetical protein